MINSSKAQATIFMIIGLLIVLGGAVFFYSTQQVRKPYEPEIKILQEKIPIEFNPIRDYATDCAYSTAVEGLRIIGKQGGYISLTNRALNKEPFTITANPTESDAVAFTKDSDLKIPYWWYLKSSNNCRGNCIFASKRPDLRQSDNSIEKQLERYLDARFENCLDNFESFKEQGYKATPKAKPKTDVTIASDDVLVIIDYPIDVESQNSKTELKQFVTRVPIDLENIYELATKITNLEIKHHYLEKHVINLIAAFSGIDREKLPPMSDMQFNFGSSISWQKSDVKNKITAMLLSYISLFQVDGTYNYERNFFESELKQRLYDSTIIPVANTSFNDLAAYFTYLDFWPVYFDLNCNGERCVPSSANSFIPFISFGIQDFRFNYDLSYPVLVEVEDPFALNNQGYRFNFFLEGNIRNNEFMNGSFAQLEIIHISERSQLCDLRTSANVKVNANDAVAKSPIEDLNVLYTLIDESCFIGATGKDGSLTEKYPIGIGGVVNFVKDNYIGKAVEFDPQVDAEQSLNVELSPIYTKKIIVKKKNVVKTAQGWQFQDQAVDLNERESATVTLTRVSPQGESDFSSVAIYEGQQSSELQIAPGDYIADMNLMLNERIAIPEKEKCEGVWPARQCFTIPKIDFGERATPGEERFPEGGLKLSITLKPQDLMRYDTIVLYAVSIDLANVPELNRVVEDTEPLGKIEEYSATNSLALQPTFQ